MSEVTIEQLYEMQKVLDERIIKEKGLEGQDLLPNTILALQVEIAELANEWRGFKHWSNLQTPKMYPLEECSYCEEEVSYTRPSPFMADVGASMCEECWNMTQKEYAASVGEYIPDFEDYPHFPTKTAKKLIEEYVDCLHFLLSIANQIDVDVEEIGSIDMGFNAPDMSTTNLFSLLISNARYILWDSADFFESYSIFRYLGDRLGLTWDQITAAYMEKNKVNHERQRNGY